jgi:hypothetical protein
MTNEEMREALIKLAERMGFSVTEIDYMARMTAQPDYDPLPPEEWGEPFDFSGRKVCVFDDDDFACISADVPKPDAQVDLRRAGQEWESDLATVAAIYDSGRELSVAQNWLLFLNGWDWLRFWSVRHPDAKARAKFAAAEADEAAERNAEKANALLRKRGIEVFDPERKT